MDISLPSRLAKFVQDKIDTGEYSDANHVVTQAIESLMERERALAEHEGYLREELAEGLRQADRGEFVEFDAESVIASEIRKLRDRRREACVWGGRVRCSVCQQTQNLWGT